MSAAVGPSKSGSGAAAPNMPLPSAPPGAMSLANKTAAVKPANGQVNGGAANMKPPVVPAKPTIDKPVAAARPSDAKSAPGAVVVARVAEGKVVPASTADAVRAKLIARNAADVAELLSQDFDAESRLLAGKWKSGENVPGAHVIKMTALVKGEKVELPMGLRPEQFLKDHTNAELAQKPPVGAALNFFNQVLIESIKVIISKHFTTGIMLSKCEPIAAHHMDQSIIVRSKVFEVNKKADPRLVALFA